MEGFVYVVNPPILPKVAFGSGRERITFFAEKKRFLTPGPGDYDFKNSISDKKLFACKLGFSAFASKSSRLSPTIASNNPPIGAYDVEQSKIVKQMAKPFGIGARRSATPSFLTPAPSNYPYHIKIPEQKVSLAFFTDRHNINAVSVFCGPYNTAKCSKCGETPEGDYWHNFSTRLDMCRGCMHKAEAVLRSCHSNSYTRTVKHREIKNFVPARYCGFFHKHDGTTAAVERFSRKILRFKFNKENYLHRFFPTHL